MAKKFYFGPWSNEKFMKEKKKGFTVGSSTNRLFRYSAEEVHEAAVTGQILFDQYKYCNHNVANKDGKMEQFTFKDHIYKLPGLLAPYLNLSPGDAGLYLTWLAAFLCGNVRLPILILDGPTCSGKSVLCEITHLIVNDADMRNWFGRQKLPYGPLSINADKKTLLKIGFSNDLLIYDNITAISPAQADGIVIPVSSPVPPLDNENYPGVIFTCNGYTVTHTGLFNNSIRLKMQRPTVLKPAGAILENLQKRMKDIFKAAVSLTACTQAFYLPCCDELHLPADSSAKEKCQEDYYKLGLALSSVLLDRNIFLPHYLTTQFRP